MHDVLTAANMTRTCERQPHLPQAVPLILDIDGTLLRTDLLYETFWAALGHDLLATLWVLIRCWASPARLKHELLRIARPDIALLPVRASVLSLARDAAAAGQPVYLASAADQSLVDAIAERFGLPGPHFGSHPEVNLKGAAKARLLVRNFGAQGYDYVGDSRDDLAVWQEARQVIAINPGRVVAAQIGKFGKQIRIIREPARARTLLKEIRMRQWIKSLLLLLPALAAHELSPATLLPVLVAMAAFSSGASAIYIVNDLLDLSADREHPEKRKRPIAAGTLPIASAMMASAALAATALGLSLLVSPAVAALIFSYMIGSLIYSLLLKKCRWADILALVGLFLLRVMTGAAASHLFVSWWLLALVFSVFFTLASVKRLTELARAIKRGPLPGRGYRQRDIGWLEMAASLAVVASAVVFVGYAFSPSAAILYSSPHLLALAAVPAGFWLTRLIGLSEHGQGNYDPVTFVIHDRVGLAIILVGLAIVILAL